MNNYGRSYAPVYFIGYIKAVDKWVLGVLKHLQILAFLCDIAHSAQHTTAYDV